MGFVSTSVSLSAPTVYVLRIEATVMLLVYL
jgi:hypothetical protein